MPNRRPAGQRPTTGEGRANFDTLSNARVEALVDTLAVTLPNGKEKTLLDPGPGSMANDCSIRTLTQ